VKPRIVIAPVSYPTPADPVTGIFVKDQAHVLAREFDVTVLAVQPVSLKSLAVLGRARIVSETDGPVRVLRILEPSWPTLESIASHIRGLEDAQSRRHLAIFSRALRRGFAEYMREFGPPMLVHAHMALPAGAAAINATAGSLPVVLTEHTTPSTAHTTTPWKRNVSREVYTMATQILAVSPWLAAEITREFPAVEPAICPNVVRDDIFTLPPHESTDDPRGPEFLCVSALAPRKGVDCLVRAAHLLARQRPTLWRVTIAGGGPLLSALKQQALSGPAHDRITFVPSPNRQEVCRLMQRCRALVMPSELETFGLVACEANSCGKPVFAAASGGAQFTMTSKTGCLFPIGDTDALATLMSSSLDSAWRTSPAAIRSSVQSRFGIAPFLASVHRAYDATISRFAGSSFSRTLH
jgi:glycosyltransferase involved in cell wall biosynthesis